MKTISLLRVNMAYQTGATTATLALANALVATGDYEVHILSLYGNLISLQDLGIPVDPRVRYHNLNPGAERLREGFLKTVRAYRRYLKEHRVRVACSVCLSPALTTILATRGLRIPTVLIDHSNRSNTIDYDQATQLLTRATVGSFNAIVTLTTTDSENYLKRYRLPAHRLRVIPNWVDARMLAHAGKPDLLQKSIISVGNLDPVKGYDLLIEVASLLKGQAPGWRWDIYGEGNERKNLEALIAAHGLDDFVCLKGRDLEVTRRYREYALFVMTSYFEGFPLALLESRANALPAVAFDCPTGPREMINDGQDGFLIPCYNIAQMVEKIGLLVSNETLRASLSAVVPASIERFSEDKVMALWKSLFEELTIDRDMR